MDAEFVFDNEVLYAVCEVLGDTNDGLTGSEINKLLGSAGIDDPNPTITKRDRLYKALSARQERDRSGNAVVAFVMRAMAPARYLAPGRQSVYEERLSDLNRVLAMAGLRMRKDGKVDRRPVAVTITDAEAQANKILTEVQRRGVHHEVLTACRDYILARDYYNVVLEGAKSLSRRLRTMTGLTGDGAAIATEALSLGRSGVPLLAINACATESETSEQKGFVNLLTGAHGYYRNPRAHTAARDWPVSEAEERETVDALTFISALHRRLDEGVLTPHPAPP